MLNTAAYRLIQSMRERATEIHVCPQTIAGATVIDAGIDQPGSLQAGLLMSRICLGDAAEVTIVPEDADRFASDMGVFVQSDHPIMACLGGQYAGWPVAAGKFFAMGSGPMRLARGREEMLIELALQESPSKVAGVLESVNLPTDEVLHLIASETKTFPENIGLVIAPAGSLAGSIQVVARSIETSLHKLHALEFDVRTIFSATGVAPLPPPAKPTDIIGGIGRTNDSILYGGRVTLWCDCDQDDIDKGAKAVPSSSSSDYGRPFAAIFKDYDYDFYKVDPQLFSPAKVTIINRRSGIARTFGSINTEVLRRSFFS
jgi:methenyltetrahydromethanopterin cyclohydrolase